MKTNNPIICICSLLVLISCGTDSLSPTSKEGKNDKSKVCVTGGYSNVTEISATLSGFANLTSDMTGDIKMGVVCSTNPTPDLNNGIMRVTRELNADNMFSVAVTGLLPGAKHYYRAFVYRNDVYTYGEIKSFDTLQITASVTTEGVSGITENAATILGSISFFPKANLTVKKGFYVSANNSTKPDKWYSATSTFSAQLTNLEYGKTYYYMAAAIIDDIVFTGSVKSFSTESIDVIVTTNNATKVSEHKASVSGTIKKAKPYDRLTQEAFIIYSSKNSTIEGLKTRSSYNIKTALNLNTNGEISLDLDKLSESTQYYYVVGFSIGGFEFWGDVKSFTTGTIDATIFIDSITDITELYATVKGSYQYNIIEDFPININIHFSETYSEQESLYKWGKKEELSCSANGDLIHIIQGLSPSQTYHMMLSIKIDNKVFYSVIKTLTTPTINASLSVDNVDAKSFYEITASGIINTKTVCDLSTLGFSLKGEIKNGKWSYRSYYGNTYESVFFDVNLGGNGRITASLPICTPGIETQIRFVATIHGQDYVSPWYSFVSPPQNSSVTLHCSTNGIAAVGAITLNGNPIQVRDQDVYDPSFGEKGFSFTIGDVVFQNYVNYDERFLHPIPSKVVIKTINNKVLRSVVFSHEDTGSNYIADCFKEIKCDSGNYGRLLPDLNYHSPTTINFNVLSKAFWVGNTKQLVIDSSTIPVSVYFAIEISE